MLQGMNAAQSLTPGMLQVERRIDRPIREYLVDAYEVRGLTQAAIVAELSAEYGVALDIATVSRWMGRLGIEARIVGHRKGRAA